MIFFFFFYNSQLLVMNLNLNLNKMSVFPTKCEILLETLHPLPISQMEGIKWSSQDEAMGNCTVIKFQSCNPDKQFGQFSPSPFRATPRHTS